MLDALNKAGSDGKASSNAFWAVAGSFLTARLACRTLRHAVQCQAAG